MAGKSNTTNSGNADSPDNGNVEFVGKDISNGTEQPIIDPASIGAGTGEPAGEYGDEYQRDDNGNLVYGKSGKPNRKRGRKSGGSNSGTYAKSGKGNSQAINQGIETLSQTLMIVHMGIASFTKFDEFAIDEKESNTLSRSIVNVMDQFDWAPDPRFTAIAGLVTVSVHIYGPRLYLYREHLKEKARDKPAVVKPNNVEQFNPNQFPGSLAG